MRTVYFIILLCPFLNAQVDTTFWGLRGYEDLEGNTQLFYKEKSNYSYKIIDDYWTGENRNDIFHFDVIAHKDTLFLLDGIKYNDPFPSNGKYVSDFEFIDNSLTNFYQAGDLLTSFEPNPTIIYNRAYDSPYYINSFQGLTYNLEIAKFDTDTNVYVYSDNTPNGIFTQTSKLFYDLIKSTENYKLVSINSNSQNTWYVENEDGLLYKSTDTGKTFILSDSISNSFYKLTDYLNRSFFYDDDSVHIYRITIHGGHYYISVSNNNGEKGSWSYIFESVYPIYLTYERHNTGKIYFSTRKNIYSSNDYGTNYNLEFQLDNLISGIYKKPNSNLLYVTLPHQLLQINVDSIKILKQLNDYKSMKYYPLSVGNKWYYNYMGTVQTGTPIDPRFEEFTEYLFDEIEKDTLINNVKYYKIITKSGSYKDYDKTSFARYDSINGNLLFFDLIKQKDIIGFSLSSTIGDSSFVSEINDNNNINQIKCFHYADSSSFQFGKYTYRKCYSGEKKSNKYYFQLGDGFGIVKEKIILPSGQGDKTLIACIIDGRIFGDTTLVAISEKLKTTPKLYSLSQNYPNPFNPTTTIKYNIPIDLRYEIKDVRLKIYDILGREIATLVNQKQKPGSYEVEFDGANLSSGIYFYRLQAGDYTQTKKMILLK